ncbi:MAG: hypothetical protein KAJ23_14420 [Maribacter sp.]|nr:hypothetical protein [Maribacter sp.]
MCKLWLVVILLLNVVGCSKDDLPGDHHNGSATALKNGEAWSSKVYFDENTNDPGVFIIRFDVYNDQGFSREASGVSNIDNVFTLQQIVSNGFDNIEGPSSSYVTLIDDGDVVGDRYDELDLENNNSFQFTNYNSSRGEIEGVFNISYVLTRDDGEGEAPPTKLEFTEGRFSAKAKRSWFE